MTVDDKITELNKRIQTDLVYVDSLEEAAKKRPKQIDMSKLKKLAKSISKDFDDRQDAATSEPQPAR